MINVIDVPIFTSGRFTLLYLAICKTVALSIKRQKHQIAIHVTYSISKNGICANLLGTKQKYEMNRKWFPLFSVKLVLEQNLV